MEKLSLRPQLDKKIKYPWIKNHLFQNIHSKKDDMDDYNTEYLDDNNIFNDDFLEENIQIIKYIDENNNNFDNNNNNNLDNNIIDYNQNKIIKLRFNNYCVNFTEDIFFPEFEIINDVFYDEKVEENIKENVNENVKEKLDTNTNTNPYHTNTIIDKKLKKKIIEEYYKNEKGQTVKKSKHYKLLSKNVYDRIMSRREWKKFNFEDGTTNTTVIGEEIEIIPASEFNDDKDEELDIKKQILESFKKKMLQNQIKKNYENPKPIQKTQKYMPPFMRNQQNKINNNRLDNNRLDNNRNIKLNKYNEPEFQIKVTNFPDICYENIYELFSKYGKIKRCKMIYNNRTSKFLGIVYIYYLHETSRDRCIDELHRKKINYSIINIEKI